MYSMLTVPPPAMIQRVFVYDVEAKESHPITDGLSEVSEPCFDASGDSHHTSGGVTTNVRFVNCHARNAPRTDGNAWEMNQSWMS